MTKKATKEQFKKMKETCEHDWVFEDEWRKRLKLINFPDGGGIKIPTICSKCGVESYEMYGYLPNDINDIPEGWSEGKTIRREETKIKKEKKMKGDERR